MYISLCSNKHIRELDFFATNGNDELFQKEGSLRGLVAVFGGKEEALLVTLVSQGM